jgi:predicted permease
VSLEAAAADLAGVAARLKAQYPVDHEQLGTSAHLLRDSISRQARLLLLTLSGAALCVLLLACANLANLLLARAVGREREMSLRAALGAGRERLVRQVITESAVLSTIGGAAGVLLAVMAIPALARLVPNTLPLGEPPSLDLRVLGLAALLTALTALAFGVIPALRAGRASGIEGLREGTRTGGAGRQRTRFVLVSVEVMASVVLLVSSGLLVRAVWRLQQTDPGFRAEDVLTLNTPLPLAKYGTLERRQEFYRRVLDEVRALPGVSSAAYISFLPIVMRGGIQQVLGVDGQPIPRNEAEAASLRFVTPQYFGTLGIPVRSGRDVSDSDTREQPNVAVVSESFARRHWPNSDAIGRRFLFGLAERTVVGVVGDVRMRGFQQESEPQVYLPYLQAVDSAFSNYIPKALVIRGSLPPATLIPAVRRIVQAADPEQPVADVRPLADIVAGETASRVAQLRVLGALAAIALVLAIVGIHGLLSFTVSRRVPEFGVRLALGARPSALVRMVLGEGALLALVGVIPGMAIAFAAGGAMRALLVGVKPSDPLTMAVAVVVSALMVLVGSLAPALRAVRVDPVDAMRGS